MSTHINAKEGEIAPLVLLPGDPLRAKFIAENFLENAVCYNEVRGMFGFTGTYKGVPVSVQGTGMGQPSFSIYAQELFQFYNVQKAIRVGTAGSVSPDLPVRSVLIANGSCSDSSLLTSRFGYRHFAPVPDFSLMDTLYHTSKELGIDAKVGLCVSSDRFYEPNGDWKLWASYGVLGIEMESAELFTLAAEFKRKAAAVFTISDNIATGEATTSEERQSTFTDMMKLALEAIIK